MTKPKKSPPPKLNAKQLAFVAHYIEKRNATEAAKKAGYSEKTAYSQGQRLLKNVEIAKLINESTQKVQKESEINAKWVMRELAENHKTAKAAKNINESTKALTALARMVTPIKIDPETANLLAGIQITRATKQ